MTQARPHDRHARLRQIERLDLERDHRLIAALSYADFQSIMLTKSFNGFMFTFAAPRISRILAATGEIEKRIAKRVVDTALIASTVIRHGPQQGDGEAAARRVHAMHSRYRIHPDDFVVVAAEEFLGTVHLVERYGWRPLTDKEREAHRLYASAQALAFGSPKPLPDSFAEVDALFEHYLETEVRFEPQNQRLANVLLDWFAGLAPAPVRPLFRRLLLADLDPRIVRACGLKVPPAPARWAARAMLKGAGRQDPLPDDAPDKLAPLARLVYPDGWTIEDLGTKPPTVGAASAAPAAAQSL
jgi:uncharacterized protein (DUF2236 family)